MADILPPEFPPLLPSGFHRRTLAEVRAEFVAAAAFTASTTRDKIMRGLERVVYTLNNCYGLRGELWLDGSFLTEKIDPKDVDYLLCVPSDIYDRDTTARTTVDWASHEDRLFSHYCDGYKWVEYLPGHPLFNRAVRDRTDWINWYGHSRAGVPKGIVVVSLPAVMQ